jgi:phosphopantothenoylcysteine decarboxylase/phosphopantothenate--cysteine ligase
MSEPEFIAIEAERMLRTTTGRLGGMRVLVTAGPTREPLDPVRVVTNRSSGRMGCEIAAAAYSRGADVTLVLGPSSIVPPPGVTVVRVDSTEEMRTAVGAQLGDTDLLVMAAAPADYQPTEYSQEKRPRADGAYDVCMTPTTDVLSATRDLRKPGSVIVGFALESADGIERARAKLESKGLDLIALNMVGDEGAGFETDTNKVTLISRTEATAVPLLSKREVAEKLLDAAEQLL